jgi:hypothetical protein
MGRMLDFTERPSAVECNEIYLWRLEYLNTCSARAEQPISFLGAGKWSQSADSRVRKGFERTGLIL